MQGPKKLIGCGPDLDDGIWTEVVVVMVIFALAEQGIPIRGIVQFLNEKGIPSPRGTRWSKTTIGRMLRNSAYKGQHVTFATRGLPKVRGRKTAPRVPTTPDEQVIVPVPAIIGEEQFAAVQARLVKNKARARRNLQHPYKGLLRGGLAKCASCKGTLYIQIKRGHYAGKTGIDADQISYQCSNYTGRGSVCHGCYMDARVLDEAAWQKAKEIILTLLR